MALYTLNLKNASTHVLHQLYIFLKAVVVVVAVEVAVEVVEALLIKFALDMIDMCLIMCGPKLRKIG